MSTTPTPTPTPAPPAAPTPAPAAPTAPPAPPAKVAASIQSTAYASPVSISVAKIPADHGLVFEITATVGNTVVTRRHTFIQDEAGSAAIDTNSLRTALAASAQLAADKAAWTQAAAEVDLNNIAEQTQ